MVGIPDNPASLDDFGTDAPVDALPLAVVDQAVAPEEDNWEEESLAQEDDQNPAARRRKAVFDIKNGIPCYLYDQPLEDGVTQYEVQRGFTVEGKTYRTGDVIKVQCRFCTLWNREWLGKVRCHPGRTLRNGTIMAADRFSCEQYFICKEMEAEFKSFLTLSHPAIMMVRQLLPATRHVLELERWARRFLKRHQEVDPVELFKVARDFLSTFTSFPQIVLLENFVRDYGKLQAVIDAKLNRKKGGRPPLPHGQGDLVSWLEPEFGSVLKGVVVKRARGQLKVLCIEGPDHLLGQKLTYNYDEWRKSKNPTIVRKAVDAIMKAHK
jgi:hypothetical protein